MNRSTLRSPAVRDHAWRLDHNLIKLLLTDDEIKATFFDEINRMFDPKVLTNWKRHTAESGQENTERGAE